MGGSPHTPAGGAHELRSRRCVIRRESTHGGSLGGGSGGQHSQGALLVGGSPGVRYTSPFAWPWGTNLAATPCARAQFARLAPPSRGPIRPKRAAISRLLALNVKRDLARLENREIARVLERGAGLITAISRLKSDPHFAS